MNNRAIRLRVLPVAFALGLPLLFAGCGGSEQPPEAAAAAPPAQLEFPARHRIPVRLDMRATVDGGRVAGIAGAWRGEFTFDGGDATRCAIDGGGAGTIEPGTSHDAHLVCAGTVRLPDGGSRGFRVQEDGRDIASGVVQP